MHQTDYFSIENDFDQHLNSILKLVNSDSDWLELTIFVTFISVRIRWNTIFWKSHSEP